MLYNLVIFLGLVLFSPKLLLSKKYRASRLQRLGFFLPKNQEKRPLIWMHMVSVGETKAVVSLYENLRKKYPNALFALSFLTVSGYKEATRSLPDASFYFFLPFDLSWIMKRLVSRLRPILLILVEGDFWYQMMNEVKKRGGKVVVINGKISQVSTQRFNYFLFFSRKLFGLVDHFCVQNQEYADRFSTLTVPKQKITVTGNLKLTNPLLKLTKEEKLAWQKHFNITQEELVITVGSTHELEEKLLVGQLFKGKILLVPRHPERFAHVQKFLKEQNNPRVILVEQMGILSICYQLSHLAIVGGSFISGIGGHNIFEPIQAGIPVIFGPFMEKQKDLVQVVLQNQLGIQTPIEHLPQAILQALALQKNFSSLPAFEEIQSATVKILEEVLS